MGIFSSSSGARTGISFSLCSKRGSADGKVRATAVLFFAVIFFIAAITSYRVLRLNFFIKRYTARNYSTSSEGNVSTNNGSAKSSQHPGLKSYIVSRDGKDMVVFYRPLGLSRPSAAASFHAGEDLAYIATEIPSEEKPGDVLLPAFKKLLEGPSSDEEREGLYSLIPVGARVKKITLSDGGLLTIDFNKKFSPGGGSLAMSQARLAVEETARQFPGVKSVEILVEGRRYNFEP